MALEIKTPVLPESVSDAKIAKWYVTENAFVKKNDPLVEVETDKVMLEVVAPESGVVEKILKAEGSIVKGEEILGFLKEGAEQGVEKSVKPKTSEFESKKEAERKNAAGFNRESQPAETSQRETDSSKNLSPSARRLASEGSVDFSKIQGSGKKGRITKEDILKTKKAETETKEHQKHEESEESEESEERVERVERVESEISKKNNKNDKDRLSALSKNRLENRSEKRVEMTRLRAKIAERLVAAQQTAAILTTFNEINMQPVMEIRQKYKEIFEKAHGVRLGLMSFFTLAALEALKHFPIVNASVEGNSIVYHDFYDIGVAVSTDRGLVVPVIRNVDTLSMAQIEKQILEYGEKAKANKLSIEELTGGTFTISNGGVFGSLLSTPILNPPQSAILGMHKIQERVIVEKGEMKIRPMMYVALSYDHRIIDGADSVKFLLMIKEALEDPARLLLDI